MNPIKILEKIAYEASVQNSSKSILSVYREAFDSKSDVELFKLRTLFMDLMENALEYTSKSKSTLQTFNEIYQGLTYHNLSENIKSIAPLITNAHLSSVEAIFALHDFKQDFDAINEMEILNNELKEIIETEEITSEQKKIIFDICQDVDNAIFEHKIIGNNAIKKLHEIMFGKLIFNKDLIESIKSISIKEKLGAVYSKVDTLNKMMNTIMSIASKASDIIDLLPSGVL